ncbi:MAG: anthranilate phosphoribosyltransferase [Desulfovibrio sp.]|nr:anthranilate phosphoribosyltransferase [Desulfovibrio sp.]
MFLLIDNYDSFTYNLVQAFQSLGREVTVVYNDDDALLSMAERTDLEMVCLSPGPSRPENAGHCLKFLEKLSPTVPVLGVCLGHQILGLFGGADVVRAPTIMHGKQSMISHTGEGLFTGVQSPMQVGRYHSLVVHVESDEANPHFRVTARGPENEVMALCYRDRPWVGVQFHPESVLTPDGMKLLGNFPQNVMARKEKKDRFPLILETLAAGETLSRDMAAEIFGKLMDGHLSEAQAAAFLMTLRMKGEDAVELAEATKAALGRAVYVPPIEKPHIDVVGTGGDGRHSFNCSTASSLVLAGMGYYVTKHGNRAVSSTCGSADAIEGLGLPFVREADELLGQLEKNHFTFLFAQNFHPSFKNIAPIRKALGVRTIFNVLGPLINPAKPSHILLGVGHPDLMPLLTETLQDLGQQRGAVVCGAGVYDEVTPLGPATIVEVREGKAAPLPLDPEDFGIKRCTSGDLEVHSKREAIQVLEALLDGNGPAPMLDMIVLNVGLAVYLLEDSLDLQKAMVRARDAVMAGVGRKIVDAA